MLDGIGLMAVCGKAHSPGTQERVEGQNDLFSKGKALFCLNVVQTIDLCVWFSKSFMD